MAPGADHLEKARQTASLLAEKGDILLYRGAKRGQTAAVFNAVAFALAVLAFQPGGVTFAGHHFEAHS